MKKLLTFFGFKKSDKEIQEEIKRSEDAKILFNKLGLDFKKIYSYIEIFNIILDIIEKLEMDINQLNNR